MNVLCCGLVDCSFAQCDLSLAMSLMIQPDDDDGETGLI